MRIFALLLISLFSYGKIRAQDISGSVIDNQGKPLANATIGLRKASDSTVVKYSVTDTAGHYRLSRLPSGRYFITVSAVGYYPVSGAAFDLKEDNVRLPVLTADTRRDTLKNAEVSAVKPLLQVRPDRMILNVQGNINSVGKDALDLLRQSPGVTVDNGNSLTLNGKNGVQVFVDGRPTYLTGNDLANYLKTIQSSSVESIEIITSPPAKYEAAGTAGIINIRLIKDKSLGTSVTANAGYNIGKYSKYNAAIGFNHRDRQLDVFGSYTYNNSINWAQSYFHRTQLDTLFLGNDNFITKTSSSTFRGGLDYYLNKKSTLGILVSATLATDSILTNSNTPIVYQPTNVTNRLLVADNRTSDLQDNYNFNLNYRYAGGAGQQLELNADYGLYHLRRNQLQPNNYFDSTGKLFLYSDDYNILSPTDIHIYSFKADYEWNFLKGRLGAGGKISYVTSDNDFQEYDLSGSARVLDSLSSDVFTYKENINAAYLNYNRTFKTLVLQAGLRVENTNSKGASTGWQQAAADYSPYDSLYPRHYTDFFPGISLSWNKDPKSQWTLSYSRRIDRPEYQDLNPFEFKVDDYTFSKGNTQLRPQYADNLGLTWTWHYAFSAALTYSHVSDLFTTVPDTTDRSKTVITKVNLADQYIAGLNLSYAFQFKWYSGFVNADGFYALYKADFGAGRMIDLNVFHTSILSQHNFRLGHGWSASLTQLYLGPNIYQSTLQARHMWGLDGGLQKSLFKGNATATVSVSDIFHTENWSAISNFAGQYISTGGSSETRQLKLSFRYRFGNKQVKAAGSHSPGSEEENKRVAPGVSGASQ